MLQLALLAASAFAPQAPLDPPYGERPNWLVRHQDADGKWDADGFARHDPLDEGCPEPGEAQRDVACTSLSLLAFVGAGSTHASGPNRRAVARAVRWLRQAQEYESGSWSEDPADQALATLALCEVHHIEPSPLIRNTARRGVAALLEAFASPVAWERDPIASGWAIQALVSARPAGVAEEARSLEGALAAAERWLEAGTDPGSGRFGPAGSGTGHTAVALLSASLLGHTPRTHPLMLRQARLLARELEDAPTIHLGSSTHLFRGFALYRLGGAAWGAWLDATKRAWHASGGEPDCGLPSDPRDDWTRARGRVASTAQAYCSLTLSFRFSRLVGAR